jgi:hypothetical protein
MKGLVFAACLALILLFGCCATYQPMPGSDRDSHGCIVSAGYSWCEPLQQCIRPWEINCTKPATPAEQLGGEKELDIKPMTPPENIAGDKEGAPVPDDAGAMEKGGEPAGNISNKTATIAAICTDEAVDAFCINHNDTVYQLYDAEGIGTGIGREDVYLMNKDNVTANCSIQFVITQDVGGAEWRSPLYTVTLEPGQSKLYSQEYNYRTEMIDDPFSGVKTVRTCKPYP